MFKTLRATESKNLNHSGRSYLGETLQLEGDLRSSGAVDVAGLVNGNVFVSEITITETGSVRGSVEAASIEINGHIEGKISADVVIVGKTAVIKGDIFFKNTFVWMFYHFSNMKKRICFFFYKKKLDYRI